MKIKIQGTPKEIADFVVVIQSQPKEKKFKMCASVNRPTIEELAWLEIRKERLHEWKKSK